MNHYLVKIFFIFIFSTTVYAAPKVVVTISPIYALTQNIMQGVAEPILLVSPGASPHTYALKPSQVSDLNSADLVIWIGESLETFLIKMLAQLPKTTKTLTLLTTPGLDPLPFRTQRTWEHDHDHAHTGFDPHVWLDPIRMQTLVLAIAHALADIDPNNKNIYQSNATQINTQLSQLDTQLRQDLTPVQNKPFIVFHDAYQYFEKRYQLNAVGAITLNPEIMPSAKHIQAIQDLIKQKNVVCIFAEPQFKPAIVDMIATGTQVREGVLDPLAMEGQGFTGYSHLLTHLSAGLRTCLAP
jgi:zinc transport system substrate-binding protein